MIERDISNYKFCEIKESKFEISKVHTTRLQYLLYISARIYFNQFLDRAVELTTLPREMITAVTVLRSFFRENSEFTTRLNTQKYND